MMLMYITHNNRSCYIHIKQAMTGGGDVSVVQAFAEINEDIKDNAEIIEKCKLMMMMNDERLLCFDSGVDTLPLSPIISPSMHLHMQVNLS